VIDNKVKATSQGGGEEESKKGKEEESSNDRINQSGNTP
jgi:hypothetical protein